MMLQPFAPSRTTLRSSLWRELIDGIAPADVAIEQPEDWQGWLTSTFGGFVRPPFAPYHEEFWEWVWGIKAGAPAEPYVAIWPRGGGKSTSVEVACALTAIRRTRTYVLYVCETQEQADTHVQNIASLFEGDAMEKRYPDVANRKVGKYGESKGWRRNRLRTESGFTVDAIGLDTAARGAKVEKERPDLLVFDDIDGILDSPGTVAKKITTITKSLLPARAAHAATLVAQNLIHSEGVVARLADGRADFLANRIVSGPHPAIRNPIFEQDATGRWVITGGEPTWEAMGIPELQVELDEIGLAAFKAEMQHEERVEGSIFEHIAFRHCRWDQVPEMSRIVVWVDPAVTDTDKSDAHGIQADGLAGNGDIYRLYSWEHRASPEEAMRRAILKAVELKAECVGVETDQGGDTWRATYNEAWDALVKDDGVPQITAKTRKPEFRQRKAGAGHGPKAYRASQMLADYERGRFVHVIGTHEALETALRRYLIRKPYDLVDAAYWSWFDLARRTSPIVSPAGITHTSTWS